MVILKATRLERGVLGRARSLCTYLVCLLGGYGGVGQPARLGWDMRVRAFSSNRFV